MEERLCSLEVLVARWVDRRPPDFSYTRYRQFAETYLRHYPGFQAINWVDKEGFIRWVYPERKNYAAKDKNLRDHPEPAVRDSFARVEISREYVITPCVELFQGGIGFASYWPLIYDGRLQGYLDVVFNISSIVEFLIGRNVLEEFRLTLYEKDRLIYPEVSDTKLRALRHRLRTTRNVRFRGMIWRLELEPVEPATEVGLTAYLNLHNNPGHLMFLFLGVTGSAGLSFLLYSLLRRVQMYQVARDQALYEVSERKRTQKALLEAEEKRKTLLATIPDIVMQIDRNRIRTWCNDAGYAFFGTDVIGKTEDHYYVGDQDTPEKLRSLFDGSKNEVYIESWQRHRNGNPRLLAWWYRKLSDETGQIVGAICTARDITDQRKLEQEREALLKELSHKNAELESFVYTVSHDLKTPLVTVEGFIGALREDFGRLLGEEGEGYLRWISEAITKMEDLINDLLDLSRIGRIIKNKTKVSFKHLVNEAVKSLSAQIRERGVTVEIPDNMPNLYGEKERLQQVVDNLIANAVKYIGQDNLSPRIDVGAEDRGKETLCFVRDNGIGIDRRYFEKIFNIFQRLPEAKKIEGNGIGLTIVKRIVEVHRGRVWVESEIGKGSTFYFTVRNKED